MTPPRLLTMAGSDSGGGAGIQADLKTFSALGCYGMAAVTALTAQNTLGVRSIHVPPADFVAEEIDAVLEDIGADAVKIGMLATAEIIRAVAAGLEKHRVRRIVLDPVMVATSGDRLLREDALDALKIRLIPIAGLVTPNLSEASALLGRAVRADPASMESAARDLLDLGCRAALVKGGHGTGPEAVDVLAERVENGIDIHAFRAPRIATVNLHGTGCTLSSAIAAFWARGASLPEAVRAAKQYLHGAIAAAAEWKLGGGHGPVHHFHAWWDA
ncbi:MAG: bifunctional hydroxymethylpyrimidine kinase/phosphomethylpyrimidine kinase [Verrucomicrobiota bacterium]|nr:bifunctional hydroxymethylpyrimidine kinase/phosphomethylpyrimidine kinase [Verrucomicrobiota bacterium]